MVVPHRPVTVKFVEHEAIQVSFLIQGGVLIQNDDSLTQKVLTSNIQEGRLFTNMPDLSTQINRCFNCLTIFNMNPCPINRKIGSQLDIRELLNSRY